MRHSRKAVMREHYMLYLKKNIFNGRYFVRNMQIGVGLCLLLLLAVGIITAFAQSTNDSVRVGEILLNSEEEQIQEEIESVEQQYPQTVQEVDMVDCETSESVTKKVTDIDAEKTSSPMDMVEDKKEESLFDDRCIANVEETLNVRLQPDAESEFVGCMKTGSIAKVLGTNGDWTKIKSGDVEGYVLSDYVLTGEEAKEFSKQYVTLRACVLEDGVNVRKEATVESDILEVLDKDTTLEVLEVPDTIKAEETEKEDMQEVMTGISEMVDFAVENEKDITWVCVALEDGTTGYVASEWVEIEELYELAVSAEELERIALAEAEARRIQEEEAQRQAAEASRVVANTNSNPTEAVVSNDSYQTAVTETVQAEQTGDCYGTFTITAYCGCQKCSSGHNRTASGTIPTEGRTIAADTSMFPYGTQLVIDGIVYTVEDCGSGVSGNHIDIFFATHEKAVAYGRRTLQVYKY